MTDREPIGGFPPMKILTEDGIELGEGDHAYDYYSMKPGVIEKFDSDTPREDMFVGPLQQGSLKPWFRFRHDDGRSEYLNGQRICSDQMAIRKGYPNADQPKGGV